MKDYNILAELTFSSKKFRKIFRKRLKSVLKILVKEINSLTAGWTAYTKDINPLVLRIDLPLVDLYIRTLGFISFSV